MNDVLLAKDGRTEKVNLSTNQRKNSNGSFDIICPFCPPRKPEHRNERKLNINPSKYDQVTVFRCNHCGITGIVVDDTYWEKKNITVLTPIVQGFIHDDIVNWFEKKRKISRRTLQDLFIYSDVTNVRQIKNPNKELAGEIVNKLCIAFPYVLDNNVINVKYRDDLKNFKLIYGASKIVYNIDSIKGFDFCVWSEGEIDVASWHEIGIKPSVSPPNGATITENETNEYNSIGKISSPTPLNMEWLEPVYHRFAKIEKHYIATDADGPGWKLREEIARRFGKDKCYIINLREARYKDPDDPMETYRTCKDPNEVLVNIGPEKLRWLFDNASPYPVDHVIAVPTVIERLVFEFKSGKEKGVTTGYKKLDPYFTWKKGQSTVLNGYPGEGKTSFVLNLIVLSILIHKFKWAIYSPENYPISNIVDTMVEIIVGSSSDRDVKSRMSLSQYIAAIKNILINNIYFIDREEGFTPEDIRAIQLEMIRKYGIDAVLIDPWRGLVHKYRNLDEYLEYQIGMINRFTIANNVITLINHHPPTPDRTNAKIKPPNPFMLKGGEIWYSRIYNMLSIHRQDKFSFENLKTEVRSQKIKEHKLTGVTTPEEDPVILTFERKSGRFLEYNENGRLIWPGAEFDLLNQNKLF